MRKGEKDNTTLELKKQALAEWDTMDKEIRDQLVADIRAEKLFNMEAEQAVLGVMLSNKNAYFQIGNLRPEDFYFEHHAEIFRDIEMLLGQGKTPSPVLLGAKYDSDPMFEDLNGKQYLVDIISNWGIISINIGEYSEIISDLATRRKLITALKSLTKKILSPQAGEVADDLKSFVMSEILGVDDGKKGRRIRTLQDVTKEVEHGMFSSSDPDSTGIEELDRALAGGLYPSKVYSFPAVMKTGKTMLMATMFTNIMRSIQQAQANDEFARQQGHDIPYAAPKPVLYIAAEMSDVEITQRIVARLIEHNSLHFLTKKNDVEFQDKVTDFANKSASMSGLLYDAAMLRFSELKYILTVAVKRQKIRGFFLDSFNLVTPDPSTKFDSDVKFRETLAQWITSFCKENDIWCVTTNQINRDGKIRGGDAEPMFFDGVFVLDKNRETDEAWLSCKVLRYAPERHAGDKRSPCMKVEKAGPHFAGIVDQQKIITKESLQDGYDPLDGLG